ncbi:MAG: peptidase, partial [Pedobacter sp.]|nr:peptidase [Pedobacter sp.]
MNLKTLIAATCIILPGIAEAQKTNTYNPTETFSPTFYTYPGNDVRTAEGRPGKSYWHNRADYQINATLDTLKQSIQASATITYTNNSPNPLSTLWLHLDQQIYREDARAKLTGAGYSFKESTTGNTLKSVDILKNGKRIKAEYLINDTRMQIRLPQALEGDGAKVQIEFIYQYTIPGAFGNRTDFVNTANGKIYEIAQWYPRMCVYDENRGWDT